MQVIEHGCELVQVGDELWVRPSLVLFIALHNTSGRASVHIDGLGAVTSSWSPAQVRAALEEHAKLRRARHLADRARVTEDLRRERAGELTDELAGDAP